MTDSDKLTSLLEEGVIDEVLGQLQSGKEASVYAVRRAGEVVAAKVYKERDRRSFKNNAMYAEGRKVRSSRDERALARGSRHGKATQEAAWKSAESETLVALHAAGVRVPRPIAFHDGVVLMELVSDARGQPAPRLMDVRPAPEEATALHAVLLGEIAKMLLAGWVHGDLSAYNVLLSARGPVVIDFPQAVSASHNNQARLLVERDVRNVTDYLAGFAPSLAAQRNAGADLWRRYERGELDLDAEPVPGEPAPSLDPEDVLAREIEAAKAIPHSVGRALGRRASGRPARREREGRKPAPPAPASRGQAPASRGQAPASRGQAPASRGQAPASRTHAPAPRPQGHGPRPKGQGAPRPAPPRSESRPPAKQSESRPPAKPSESRPPAKPRAVWNHLADRYGLGDEARRQD
jgi:RIO kinase 1